jgi:uncharacterized protein
LDTYSLNSWQLIAFVLGGVASGAMNAIAGGGTLITFPLLTTFGIPAVTASMTNTVALCPGYMSATLAQSCDLRGQTKRLWLILPVITIGGIAGGILLLKTGEQLFRAIVPYLILFASGLLAVQDWLRKWLNRRMEAIGPIISHEVRAVLLLIPVSIYCGYFGAGAGVIILAVLGLVIDDSLNRLNALKQAISFVSNIAAATYFILTKEIIWPAALMMAVGAIIGGNLGGRLASRIHPATLRWIVVSIGVIIATIYLIR